MNTLALFTISKSTLRPLALSRFVARRDLSSTRVATSAQRPLGGPPTGPNDDPGAGMVFSLRQLWEGASPRTRFWLLAGLALAVTAEGSFYIIYGPTILAKMRRDDVEE